MKLQILSDTHCYDYTLDPTADLIVHAGDFGNNGMYFLLEFANKCNKMSIPYVIVPGHHDLYSTEMTAILNYLDSLNINYLKDGKEFKFKDKTFVGGTLFTNFRSNKLLYTDNELDIYTHKDNAEKFIYDFKSIGYNGSLIKADNYITEFNKQWNWIQNYKDRDDVIVLTHFPPNLCCLSDYWRDHPTDYILNPYFVNDLDVKGFKLWISGHVHHAVDTVIDDCRIIVNPLGYRGEHNKNGYIDNFIIEV